MSRDLSPEAVGARLARLRALYVPMSEAEARARLEERPDARSLAEGARARLAELRALLELTERLHAARGTGSGPSE